MKKVVLMSGFFAIVLCSTAMGQSTFDKWMGRIDKGISIAKNTYEIYDRYRKNNSYSGHVNTLLYKENADLNRQMNFYKQTNLRNIEEKEIRSLYSSAVSINKAIKGESTRLRCENLSSHSAVVSELFESIKYHETTSSINCLSKMNTVNFHNQYGHTPLTSSSFHGHLDIVRLIVRWGGDVDITGRDGMKRTPLHLAIKNGHREVAKFLYCKGGNLNARDSRGKTPLDYDRSSYYRNMECY